MTGLRGIAAVWVMTFHAQQNAGKIFGLPFLERIRPFGTGSLGVDLFFMLSGFILMYAHERDFHGLHKDQLFRFARLRFMRVYPLNAIVLFLISILVALQPGFVAWMRVSNNACDFTFGAFLRTLFLATRWFLPVSGDWNQPVWSLSLEVVAYVMFPFLAFFALRLSQKWKLIGLATLSIVIGALILKEHPSQSVIGQIALARMIPCFIAGIAVFRLWELSGDSVKKHAGWVSTFSVACILCMCTINRGTRLLSLFFAMLLYGLAFERGAVNRLLSSRAAVFLGEISFPLYLIHAVPLLWLRYILLLKGDAYSQTVKAVALVCWAAGCVVVATLLHFFAEKPFHALGRRWAGARIES